jgi:long-subunit fatty acid transport protein
MLVWLLALPSALAGGYYYPDAGIIANGRGCAYVAGANTQFAQYYNPAGLVNVDRPQLNVGISGVKQAVTFTRINEDPADLDGFYEPVQNEGKLFTVPELGFATPIGDKFGFAFGFTSPFAPDYVFDADGSQRYSIVDNVIWSFQVGPSFAYRPVPQVAVGLGLQWQVLRVEERLKVTTSGQLGTDVDGDGLMDWYADNPAGDVSVDARVWDRFTPGFNLGALITPVPQISVGVSLQPSMTFSAKGHGTLDFTGHTLEQYIDQTVWTDDDITLELQMPLLFRSGVAVRPVEGLEIEGDFVYEGWKTLEDIEVPRRGGNR